MCDSAAKKHNGSNRLQSDHKTGHLRNKTDLQQKQRQQPSDVDPWDIDRGQLSTCHKNQYVQEWLQEQQQQKQQQHQRLKHASVRLQNPTSTRNQAHVLMLNQAQVNRTKTNNTTNFAALNPLLSSSSSTIDSVLALAKHPPSVAIIPPSHDTVGSANRDSWLISFERDMTSSQTGIRQLEPPSCHHPLPLHCTVTQNKTLGGNSEGQPRNSSSRSSCKQAKSKSTGDETNEHTCWGRNEYSFTRDNFTNDLSRESEQNYRRRSPGCGGSVEGLSLLFEHCRFQKCINFVSKYTRPYCHEHVNVEACREVPSSQDVAQTEMFSVMLGSFCRVSGCANMTSRSVYPYCYEHLDHHGNSVEPSNPAASERCRVGEVLTQNLDEDFSNVGVLGQAAKVNAATMTDEVELSSNGHNQLSRHNPFPSDVHDLSILPDSCAVVGCRHFTSRYTKPVCYEHLNAANFSEQPTGAVTTKKKDDHMDRSLVGRDAVQDESTNDIVGTHIIEANIKATHNIGATKRTEQGDVQQQYLEAMVEVEERVKRFTPRCHSLTCLNYGNQPCAGFCHACYGQICRG